MVDDFSAEFGVEVEISTFNNMDEALAKIRSSQVDFDVFFPTVDVLGKMSQFQLLQPLNLELLPNRKNLWSAYTDPDKPWYENADDAADAPPGRHVGGARPLRLDARQPAHRQLPVPAPAGPLHGGGVQPLEFEWWLSAADWRTGEDLAAKYPPGRWGNLTEGQIPCADYTGAPSAVPGSAYQIVYGGNDYTVNDLLFNNPSANPDAAAVGWLGVLRYADSCYDNLGSVGQDLMAFYAQDDWRIGKSNLSLGVRVESQTIKDSQGGDYFDFDTTFSPRVGYSYDVKGDGTQTVWAHYGRLYDPLRDNTSSFAAQLDSPLTETQMYFAPAGLPCKRYDHSPHGAQCPRYTAVYKRHADRCPAGFL